MVWLAVESSIHRLCARTLRSFRACAHNIVLAGRIIKGSSGRSSTRDGTSGGHDTNHDQHSGGREILIVGTGERRPATDSSVPFPACSRKAQR